MPRQRRNMDTSIQLLYVLELKNGKYYVGKTNNLQRRFQQHVDGAGSVWTRKYSPLAIERSVIVDGPLHEDRVTKELMLKHGIDNVRGGSYCRIDLDAGQYQSLTTELRSASGVCFKCGRPGHFAAQCHLQDVSKKADSKAVHKKKKKKKKRNPISPNSRPEPKLQTWGDDCIRCGRYGHGLDSCYATTNVDGDCIRCGRSGHSSDSCYAKTTVHGGDILSDSSEENDSDSD